VYDKGMLFGSHISAAGGVEKVPERAYTVGCEVFQFFSRSPQGGPAPKLTTDIIQTFKQNCKKCNQVESYIHAPYYINFASPKNTVRYTSSTIIRQELERGSVLGVKYVMTHLGSSRDVGEKQGVQYVVDGLQRILEGYGGSTQFLIEIAAGAGQILGDSFEEIAEMIGMADVDINEKKQIETSLYYLDKKLTELENHKNEIRLLEEDLEELKKKLLKRLKQLKNNK